MQRLEGKVIVIAGAGGIGNELARRYAREGASVVLGDIDEAAAQAAVAEIHGSGGSAVATFLDGGVDSSVADAIALAVARFGGLDGFHANYACVRDSQCGGDIVTMPLEAFDEVMRVNARGFMVCTRLAIPEMLKRGGGSLVYTTSGAAFLGEPERLAYAMSKVAVHAMLRHVTSAFGRRGIRANAIAPGAVTHPRFEAVVPQDSIAAMRARNPSGRIGTPQDVAAMAALLMSDEGSFVNGQVISVDGGHSMRQ